MISTQNFRVEHGLQIGDVVIDAASGIVSATSFFGDGSGLTGVGNAIIACCTSNFISCNTSISSITSAENNFFVGLNAGNCTTSGSNNIFLGVDAGSSNTEGSCNIFFGKYSGASNTEGYANNFFGASAGAANSTGFGNNYFGVGAGTFASDGQGNNFFGNLAGSGFFIDPENPVPPTPRNAGCGNNFFGTCAGIANNGALSNNFFGNAAGFANTTGSYNNFFGTCAGQTNTNGSYNIAIGHSVQLPNSSGNTQLAIGSGSTSWINGNENFNIGIGTTNPTTRLQINGVLGFGTFDNAGTRTNIRIGDNTTGANLTDGYDNIFMGIGAGNSTTSGFNNNFFGSCAGRYNTTGSYNNFFGSIAGRQNTTGCYNNFFGNFAGASNTTGSYNNFFGKDAGASNTTGTDNNFFGRSAGLFNTTGNNNTFLGTYSGISTSASNKIIFGSGFDNYNRFDSPDTTKDTQFAVGVRTDANPANYWLVGDENFNVGIGTTSPQYKLDVGGDAKISDIRISGTQIIGDGTYSTLGDLKLIPNDTLIGTGQYVKLRPTTNLDQTHIHIEAGNVNNADLYLGDDDRFVKIDHTGPVVIGVPSTATTSNWTAPSDDGPTAYIMIDTDVYPWAQYLTLGDTVTLPDTTVVNIINNSLSGNSMSLYLESNISYLTSDILVFSYTPRTEWKFNPDSSAVFPGIVTATSFVGDGSGLTNLPTPSRTTVTGITPVISSGGIGNTDISGFKTYLLLKVGISTAAWIRIYTDSDSRSNDASRPINIDPTSGSGIVAEFVSVGATTIKTGPSLIGYNDDDPEENIIYMSVNNLSGISTSIEVNLTILKMEE